jgi:chromosome partitioning protein
MSDPFDSDEPPASQDHALPAAQPEPPTFAASLIAEASRVTDEALPVAEPIVPAEASATNEPSASTEAPEAAETAEAIPAAEPFEPTEAAAVEEPSEPPAAAAVDETIGEVVPFPAERAVTEPPRPMRILAIANQKGGVGKTTTAINLGTALAAAGERVLVIDLDPQGNASTGLGIDRKNRQFTTYDVLIGQTGLREAVLPTAVERLSIAPSTVDLAGIELEIGAMRDRAFRLRDALAALTEDSAQDDAYTYVLIDCPPALNLLTVNAMAAAHAIIVPLQCEFFALEGLSQLLKTVEQVKTALNPTLAIHGIVLTMYDSRNNLSDQVVADVRQFMGSRVYNTVIPRNVRVSEAPSYGKPVLVYDLKCAGSEAYLRLASEVIQRERDLMERLAG